MYLIPIFFLLLITVLSIFAISIMPVSFAHEWDDMRDRLTQLEPNYQGYVGVITYNFSENTAPFWQDLTKDSILSWQKENYVYFVQTDNPELIFNFVKYPVYDEGHLRHGISDCNEKGINPDCIITIPVGALGCSAVYKQYSNLHITETLSHEIGHVLGLEHHANQNHLMYSNSMENVQYNYDNKLLNIPVATSIGLETQEMYEIRKVLSETQVNIDATMIEIEKLNALLEPYNGQSLTQEEYDALLPSYHKLENFANYYNYLIDFYNDNADKYNCDLEAISKFS